jgi:hypothetical protein
LLGREELNRHQERFQSLAPLSLSEFAPESLFGQSNGPLKILDFVEQIYRSIVGALSLAFLKNI